MKRFEWRAVLYSNQGGERRERAIFVIRALTWAIWDHARILADAIFSTLVDFDRSKRVRVCI